MGRITVIAVFLSLLAAFSCSTGSNQQETRNNFNPDAGGVSVDLSNCGKTSYQICGEDLVKNGSFEKIAKNGNPENWNNSIWVYTPDKKERETLLPKIKDLPSRTVCSEKSSDGKNCVRIFCPAEAASLRNGTLPDFSNNFTTNIAIPENIASAKLLLKFKYIAKSYNVQGTNNFGALVSFEGKGLKDKYIYRVFSGSADWKDAEMEFLLPKGTEKLSLQFRLYGCGEAFVDNVSLFPVATDDGVSMKLVPMSYVDNTFALSQGQPGLAVFSFKNEKSVPVKKPFAFLEVPENIKCLDSTKLCKIIETKAVPGKNIYKIDLSELKKFFGKDSYPTWNALTLLLKSETVPSDTLYPASYWYEDGDYKSSPVSFNIKVIPAIKGMRPSIFSVGTMCAREIEFPGKDSISSIADFYEGCGFNTVHSGSSKEFSQLMKNKNIKRYTQPFWFCNGYRIGAEKKPEGSKFIRPDGTPFIDSGIDAICPVEVYTKGAYYTDKVVPALRKIIVEDKTADSIMPNWEPYYYDFKGCFCLKCKEEFAKFAGIPNEEMTKLTSAELMMKYKDKWIKFRSIQHGKMMAVFEETINALGKEAGIESHFVPEIAWSQLIESDNSHFAQYNPLDYMDKLPELEPWGPYVFHSASKPYEYNAGIHLVTFEAARDMKSFVAKHVKDPAKRPRLIAFPHGLQCNDWVTEPEAIAFENLIFFLNGWEGSLVYYFPRGYDARYWQALAAANTTIAKFEDFVFKGKKIDGAEVTSRTPMPAIDVPEYWSEGGNFMQKLPGLKNSSLLKVMQFELGNKRLIAVGNFWEKGESFFTLKINGLPSGNYIVNEPLPKRTYAKNNNEISFSSSELEKGILLHAGALRWVFFVVEPFSKNMQTENIVMQDDVYDTMNKRLPAIEKVMKWEKDYRKASQGNTKVPDYSAIKEIKEGAYSCKIEKEADKVRVVLGSPTSSLAVDPVAGARIASWKSESRELVCQEKKMGLGIDAFWWPAKASCRIISPYEFAGQKVTADAVSITFKRTINADDSVPLAGMTILKTVTLSENGRKIEILSRIINSSSSEKNFSFRYHNMIAYLEQINGVTGTAAMKKSGTEVLFKREYMIKLFRMAENIDKDQESSFQMDNIFRIDSDEVVFESPNFPFKTSFRVGDKNDLYSYIFWDSGKQSCSTFEPLFRKVSLAPGQSWIASEIWTITQ